MDFWNEYEGKTIAESFPLERLLYPEGRNGFFSTFNGTGTPAVIRLTESLNDQEEMFEQWNTVIRLNHPHLITIRKFGATTVDEVPLIYAVMEPSDAGLAEILRERPMTVEETTEIANAVLPALQALHAAELVHGHVDASAILAVGETIKLRSDCAHRVIDPADRLKRQGRDVHDLAILLLQALTQQPRSTIEDGTDIPPTAEPLNEIIRKGIAGKWGLDEMSAALRPKIITPVRTSSPAAPPPIKVEEPAPHLPSPKAEIAEKQAPSPADVDEFQRAEFTAINPLYAAGFLLFLCIMGWYFFHLFQADRAVATSQATAARTASPATGPIADHPMAAAVADPGPAPTPAPTTAPANTGQAPEPKSEDVARPLPPTPSPSVDRGNWRVVVFTYNKETQAQQKVKAMERRHHSLKPAVFAPTGHAPFLVVLGGGMSREEAVALKRKAHSQGLPRDTYVQNYGGR